MWKILLTSFLVVVMFIGVGETRTKTPRHQQFQDTQTEVINHFDTVAENKTNLLKHQHKAACEETTAEPVQIICILDRSGSMENLAEDTIGGYNSFLAKQKENSSKAEVTTVLFDNQYETIYDALDIQEVPELTSEIYYARGTTALLDAVGMTIKETLGRMERAGICPEKRRVLVMIMTDGLVNASHEYSKDTVKSLIEGTTENYHWNYIFMGANMDSVAEASKIGISAKRAMNFSYDDEGIANSFSKMSEAADEMRDSGQVSDKWKE